MQYDDAGNPYLALQLPFDRGWASLALALEKAAFRVDDLNRSEGIYYTTLSSKKSKKKKT